MASDLSVLDILSTVRRNYLKKNTPHLPQSQQPFTVHINKQNKTKKQKKRHVRKYIFLI